MDFVLNAHSQVPFTHRSAGISQALLLCAPCWEDRGLLHVLQPNRVTSSSSPAGPALQGACSSGFLEGRLELPKEAPRWDEHPGCLFTCAAEIRERYIDRVTLSGGTSCYLAALVTLYKILQVLGRLQVSPISYMSGRCLKGLRPWVPGFSCARMPGPHLPRGASQSDSDVSLTVDHLAVTGLFFRVVSLVLLSF